MRTQLSKLAFTVAFGLALAYIFSCTWEFKDINEQSSSSLAFASVSSSSSKMPVSSSDMEISSSSETLASFSSDSNTDTDFVGTIMSANKFVAEPYIGNDKIKYSYSYGEYDFYYIYLGELKNIPLFGYTAQYHDGIKSTYTVSNTEKIKKSVAETITNSSKTTIGVIEEHTYSTTNKQKVSAEIKASAGWGPFKAEAKAAAEASWEQYTQDKNTSDFKQTTSLTNTIANGTEYTTENLISRSWELSRDNRVGYYRYTLFSASDVYIYVIKDATGVIYYEFREYVIPDVYFWRFDYSETPSFRKSDATSFEFDVSMLDNLPKPSINLTASNPTTPNYTLTTNTTTGGSVDCIPNQPSYEAGTQVTLTAKPNDNYVFNGWTGDLPTGVNTSQASITFTINSDITLTANFRALVEKTETATFSTAGNHTYTLKSFPATIEIYALGAGGGGQGGHFSDQFMGNVGAILGGTKPYGGTGGAGGGGEATYMKLSMEQSVTFNINVGKGGIGGAAGFADWNDSWVSGKPGGDGDTTKVSWETNTFTAVGGAGGGGSGQNLDGGKGGNGSNRPAIVSEENWLSVAGSKGTSGTRDGNISSIGGSAAKIANKGSINSFGGGTGGVKGGKSAESGGGGNSAYGRDQVGSNGGDGQVIIVVTYLEK